MRNFTILLFIFFVFFLLIAWLAPESMFIFFYIYLALLIAAICLISYLGWLRGFLILLAFILLPFLVEYLFSALKLPLFETSTIIYLSTRKITLPVTTANLILIFNTPTIFICSLVFSQKLKNYFNLRSYPKIFLVIFASILIALNFINTGAQNFSPINGFKWLIIALAVNVIAAKLFKFKVETADLFKEFPIVLYLLILSLNYIITANYYLLIFMGVLAILYLISLYNEHQYKKITEQV